MHGTHNHAVIHKKNAASQYNLARNSPLKSGNRKIPLHERTSVQSPRIFVDRCEHGEKDCADCKWSLLNCCNQWLASNPTLTMSTLQNGSPPITLTAHWPRPWNSSDEFAKLNLCESTNSVHQPTVKMNWRLIDCTDKNNNSASNRS